MGIRREMVELNWVFDGVGNKSVCNGKTTNKIKTKDSKLKTKLI